MGGPFWARKDDGAWSVVKGEYDPASEEPLAAAHREFEEETGVDLPVPEAIPLGETRSSGKRILAWAVAADRSLAYVTSSTFTLEWPPRSGRVAEFPEVDRAEWLSLDRARRAIVKSQVAFLDRLEELLT
ncbi:NUDIX domain-containing protein [Nostocoides sp. F2B08]|nr:NUDIX domain-containing protein [Tetrasphaera sp. F2B08]